MLCPFCLSDDTHVYNTRPTKSAHQLWRRRRCLECGRHFTTYERVDMSFLQIGDQPYLRTRLYQSVLGCFAAAADQLRYVDDIVDQIETRLVRQPNTEIAKPTLITLTLETLQPVSQSAWLQYLAKYQPPQSEKALERAFKKHS